VQSSTPDREPVLSHPSSRNPAGKPAFLSKPTLLSRIVVSLYILTLALLPWSWFPPFPWLHRHAQWSDIVFALTAAAWAFELWRDKRWPRLKAWHIAMCFYFLSAVFSLVMAAPRQATSAWKLVGVAELCILALVTSDIASRARAPRAIARAIVVTSLITAAAALAGLALFYAGETTLLVGTYGDLNPSEWYARVQAGFYHPNLLASFSIFAAAVIARTESELPAWLRRVTIAALWIIVVLTFSRGILGFGLAAIMGKARNRPRRILASGFAAACVLAILLLSFYKISLDPTRPGQTYFDLVTPSSRHQAISSSLETLAASPLWGSGPGNSPGQYHGGTFDAHNTAVNIASTLGLPALIAFISMIVSLWRNRRRPTDLAFWGGCAGIALDALAQDVEDFRHVWVMLGLAAANSKDSSQADKPADS
jgi:hypothetical protein